MNILNKLFGKDPLQKQFQQEWQKVSRTKEPSTIRNHYIATRADARQTEPREYGEPITTDHGLPLSLQQAEFCTEEQGMIATLPYLIAHKAALRTAPGYATAKSVLLTGTDNQGVLLEKGEPITLFLHGKNLINSKRIFRAYDQGLAQDGSIQLSEEEFTGILHGIHCIDLDTTLRSRVSVDRFNVDLYSIDEAIQGNVPSVFGSYGIYMSGERALEAESGKLSVEEFASNDVVIAEAGSAQFLTGYANLSREMFTGKINNSIYLSKTDFEKPTAKQLIMRMNDWGITDHRAAIETEEYDTGGRFYTVK